MDERNNRLFVRFYIDASRSGLMADMGADRWHTLCTLATFMDEKGECYPSQELLAHRLGVKTREAVNRRIKALCDYRWQGRPVVVKKRVRGKHQVFANNVYCLTSISPFEIFGKLGLYKQATM